MTTGITGPGWQAQAPPPVDWTEGPRPRTVSVKAVTASQQLLAVPCFILSFSYGETTGSARALAYLHDGLDVTDVIAGVLAPSSGSGGGGDPGWPGIYCTSGIYLEVSTGTISVSVTYVPVTDQVQG